VSRQLPAVYNALQSIDISDEMVSIDEQFAAVFILMHPRGQWF